MYFHMPFVSASIYQKAIQLSLSEGLSPGLLAPHFENLNHKSGSKYVPMDWLLDIYELAEQHLKAGYGIRQGRQCHSDDYGTLGLAWKTCWRARDVLDRAERYMILVTDQGTARIEENGGITKICLTRQVKREGMKTANEATFVMLTGIMKEITGQVIQPVEVMFQHSRLESTDFREYFKCPVNFGQPQNHMLFNTADLDTPTIKADQSIHKFLIDRMEEEKKGIYANADQFLEEMHTLIAEALPSGIPSVIQIAECLGMSARTLKRRLSEKQLTFRELVQDIQHHICRQLIRNTNQSMAEIAFQAGFSEQSAFNRAFKRWTGASPANFRKNA